MKQTWRKWVAMLPLVILTCLLSGCLSSSTVEDMFTLPQPPIEYTELAERINQLIADGYEYASPTGGQNIQSVQMVDLNQDGHNEAVAFFRRLSDEKPLKIMVFSAANDTYELVCTIESSGTSADSVQYQDMNADGILDLIVGWRISSDLQTVAVYAIDEEPQVLLQNVYTRYSIQELDGDGMPSLLLLRADAEGVSAAEFYGWRGDAMTMVHRATLSVTMVELSGGSVVSGMLEEDRPAVFITGVNELGMAVTDILVCTDSGALVNAAVDRNTGVPGVVYPYRQLLPQDINGDGIIEIPAPAEQGEPGKQSDGLVDWLQCSLDGQVKRVCTTYHCISSGWYLTIPEKWADEVTTVAVDSTINEAQVQFRVENQPVLAIYAITGENRENRALKGNRMVLRRQTSVVYAGELLESAKEWNYTDEQLRSDFQLIVLSWGS